MSRCDFITLDFAVHTAHHGYSWSSVPSGMTEAELDECYRHALSLKPRDFPDDETFRVDFRWNGRVIVASIQTVRAWDANGRDAEYAAFAVASDGERLTKAEIAAVFECRELLTPVRDPVREITVPCSGGALAAEEQKRSGGALAAESDAGKRDWLAISFWIVLAIAIIYAIWVTFVG